MLKGTIQLIAIFISTALNAWILMLLSGLAFNYNLGYARSIAITFLIYAAGTQFNLARDIKDALDD